MNWTCLVRGHRWKHWFRHGTPVRQCQRCHKTQIEPITPDGVYRT